MARVQEHKSKCRIPRDTAPSAAAFRSRKNETRQHSIRGVRAHVDGLVVNLRTVLLCFRRDFADFRARHTVAGEASRLEGKRLRRPCLIAKSIESWYRPLLHTENRFASQSMEHEEQALFRHLRHSRNALSVLHGFDECR